MSDLAAQPGPADPTAHPRRPPRPTPVHGGMSVPRFVATHLLGAIFPVTAGALLFSWRALAVIGMVLAAVAVALLVWRRVGSRGVQARFDHGIWFGLLLALTLPADLLGGANPVTGISYWPLPLAAGGVLVIFIWLLGGVGSGRVHPVLVTYLLLFVLFKDLLVPQHVLQRGHLFVGGLFNAMSDADAALINEPWLHDRKVHPTDAIRREPAARLLGAFTQGRKSGDLEWVSLDALLRERMPPLEDLIVAGHPRPIGCASAIALIVGGLFMIYRGLIDYRVPLMIVLAATVAMLLLPVPVVVGPNDATWSWLPIRDHAVGWQIGLTLISYELMAGPLLFMAFFLATSSAVRPISRRARTIYAVLIGILAAGMQLYVSVSIGPYLALLAASLLTPTLDKIFGSRTLV